MCQPSPGLRCSGDQAKKVDSTLKAYLVSTVSGDNTARNKAFNAFYEEKVEYDATFNGMQELRYQIKDSKFDNVDATPALIARLEAGTKRHGERREALKANDPAMVSPIPALNDETRKSLQGDINEFLKENNTSAVEVERDGRKQKLVSKVLSVKKSSKKDNFAKKAMSALKAWNGTSDEPEAGWKARLQARLETIDSLPESQKNEFGGELRSEVMVAAASEQADYNAAEVRSQKAREWATSVIADGRAQAVNNLLTGKLKDKTVDSSGGLVTVVAANIAASN